MKKVSKVIAYMLAFAIIVMSAPISAYAGEDKPKNFTYSLEESKQTVNTLLLEKGNTVDLKANIPDIKEYRYQWQTSNPDVAMVNQDGVVTTYNNGTAYIKLIVGDGTKYSSTYGVSIYVGAKKELITVGLPNHKSISEYDLPMGKNVDFAFYGVVDWNSGVYQYEWKSSNSDVATVDTKGLVSPRKIGETTITLLIRSKVSGLYFPTQEVKVNVVDSSKPVRIVSPTGKPTVMPTSKPTVAPSSKPTITSTPSPTVRPTLTSTPKPTATSTPTPTPTLTPTPTVSPTPTPTSTPTPTPTATPTPKPITFTAELASDKSFKIKFNQSVSKSKSSFTITSNSDTFDIESVKWNEDKTVATVTMADYLWEGYSYTIKVDGSTNTTSVSARFGVPDSIKLTWTSLGEEDKAYVANDTYGFPVDTKLGVKLMCGEMDVTYTYLMQGYVQYEVLNDYDNYYSFFGDSITFYDTGKSVKVKATYSYWDNSGRETKLESTTKSISATKAPTYKPSGIIEWTVIDKDSELKIDWDSPIHEVIGGTEDSYQIVSLFMDNYGYKYSTHENGVYGDIKSVDDYECPLAAHGYTVEYAMPSSNVSNYYVDSEGLLAAFNTESRTGIKLVANNMDGRETTIGATPVKILAPSKLATIEISNPKVQVSTAGVDEFQSEVCTNYVQFKLVDQYGKEFKGDVNLEIVCSDSSVSNMIQSYAGGPAYISGDRVIVSGPDIRSATSRTSVQFTVRDSETKIGGRFTVSVLDPATDVNGNIVVSGWALDDASTYDVTLKVQDTGKTEVVVPVNIYETSRSNVNVGIRTEGVYITTNANASYNANNCSEGDLYISVVGPDNKALPDVSGKNYQLGLRVNQSTGKLEIVAAVGSESSPNYMRTLPNGNYTIRATYITKNDGQRVQTAKKNAVITIQQTIPTVQFIGVSDTTWETPITDISVAKEVVASLFKFRINGEETKITSDMIHDIKYTNSSTNIRVTQLTLNVPFDGETAAGVGYSVTLNNINRNITIKTE